MITFQECWISGYPPRTEWNINLSDATVAIAKDFNSLGEKLTKKLCLKHGKPYFPIEFDANLPFPLKVIIMTLGETLKYKQISSLNFAGNGIYSFTENQEEIDEWMFDFLLTLQSGAKHTIKAIRSGGQTGIDEAALKAADKLGLKVFCLTPKDWLFRGKDRKDIKDKEKFLARFKDHSIQVI